MPRAFIAWLVEDRAATLIQGHPLLDEVIVLPRTSWSRDSRRLPTLHRSIRGVLSSMRELRRKRFDLAIDFQGNCRSGLWAFISGAKSRIGFAGATQREANYLFMRKHVRPANEKVHKVEKYLDLLRECDLAGGKTDPVLPLSEDEGRAMELWLRKTCAEELRPVVAIHPGVSTFGFFKRWPAEAYGRVVRKFSEIGIRALLTWGPGEREEVERIRHLAGDRGTIGPRTPSLLSLVELLRRCDLFIGSDSGPLHLASAVGTPTVALFGPKDPRVYGPYGARSRIVRTGVECSPCIRRSCSDPVCMTTLSPESVIEASLSLLGIKGK
ncbi:MAG: glycosyltransferase family 9 protein [Planctomycetota bacterium]|nr:glycosyltransferase family 9 protein [Planctomycetota bacterium]